MATIQRAARRQGLSPAVAGQLAFCRRHSTRLNYQSKWSIYCSWCRSHDRSVSCPSIAKISDFLLFLRRQRSLSCSNISGFRSMLSAVFRFSLSELSSSSIIRDLLRSFRLERPSVPLRAPPWDLSLVLRFLRSSSFEPLSVVSLRQLTKKTLFFLSLAIAQRLGELQAVSRSVSFSGPDIHLSFLPEFRAKTESEANCLPRSFVVRSLVSFVGDLEEELLLCPVRALRVYLHRTSRLSPRPRSLFVSPRSPSRSLSKNALSFFLREVISQASSPSSSSPPSLGSSSARQAHSIRGVAASASFLSNYSV